MTKRPIKGLVSAGPSVLYIIIRNFDYNYHHLLLEPWIGGEASCFIRAGGYIRKGEIRNN